MTILFLHSSNFLKLYCCKVVYLLHQTISNNNLKLNNMKYNRTELKRISKDYFNMYLYLNKVLVYSATITQREANVVADEHSNVKLI